MNPKKILVKTTEYIFCGITAVQVILGLVWMFFQFPHMQNWQESYEYIDISRTWAMDEYVSFLYPLLIKICTGFENLAGIPFYVPAYLIQLSVAFIAAWLFARRILKMDKRGAAWMVGYILSFPMLLQFHMAVRTESLELSGILLLIVFLSQNIWGAAVITLMLIWINPDTTLVVFVVWGIHVISVMLKERKKLLVRLGAFALAMIVGISVNVFVQTPGSRGRIQKSFWASAFQRVVTEYFSRSYAMWDPLVRTTYTIEEAMELAKRSDNMMYVVGPKLESDWGREKANELYRQMAVDCFRVRTRDIVYRIRDDSIDTVLLPFSALWQDDGERISKTGWNYARFRNETGALAKYIWYYALIVHAALVALAVIKLICTRKLAGCKLLLPAAGLAQVIWSVFAGSGAVDYGNVLVMITFWCILACANISQPEEN